MKADRPYKRHRQTHSCWRFQYLYPINDRKYLPRISEYTKDLNNAFKKFIDICRLQQETRAECSLQTCETVRHREGPSREVSHREYQRIRTAQSMLCTLCSFRSEWRTCPEIFNYLEIKQQISKSTSKQDISQEISKYLELNANKYNIIHQNVEDACLALFTAKFITVNIHIRKMSKKQLYKLLI